MSKRTLLILFLSFIVPSIGGTYETDQFNNRLQFIEDSTSIMNRQVTLAIAGTITPWSGPRDKMKVVDGIYHKDPDAAYKASQEMFDNVWHHLINK